jgi:hypothetical protein
MGAQTKSNHSTAAANRLQVRLAGENTKLQAIFDHFAADSPSLHWTRRTIFRKVCKVHEFQKIIGGICT